MHTINCVQVLINIANVVSSFHGQVSVGLGARRVTIDF